MAELPASRDHAQAAAASVDGVATRRRRPRHPLPCSACCCNACPCSDVRTLRPGNYPVNAGVGGLRLVVPSRSWRPARQRRKISAARTRRPASCVPKRLNFSERTGDYPANGPQAPSCDGPQLIHAESVTPAQFSTLNRQRLSLKLRRFGRHSSLSLKRRRVLSTLNLILLPIETYKKDPDRPPPAACGGPKHGQRHLAEDETQNIVDNTHGRGT